MSGDAADDEEVDAVAHERRIDALAPDGGHVDPDNFRSRVWAPAVAAAGLEGLRIHDLRHTTASLAIGAGADVKLLQTMLGHASAVMTLDRYGHLIPGRGQDVADRLDQMVQASRVTRDEPLAG